MKKHTYKIQNVWDGNNGKGTLNYKAYDRIFNLNGEGKKHVISGSSDPAFLGDSSRYNPEEMLLGAISSCHMLWYLHLCAKNGVVVIEYVDDATAIMEENKNGSGQFESVTLHPKICIDNADMLNKAHELHNEAHEYCFVARSCNFKIYCQPSVNVR